ncbi:putative nuclease HARBI1 [Penaeus indicus]|uniref:putative nuclease HARBI1 n=1 Tax=Penaeus indicus TaxID=29960 RepID=UPI00300D423C
MLVVASHKGSEIAWHRSTPTSLPVHVVTGESFTSLGYQFRVGKATVHKIVKETSKAIWETLQPQYLPVPDEHQWEEIARTFFEKWNIPNCIGSIDGKHCRLKCPAKAGSLFYNYKGYHSIVLLAIVDANCCFTLIDVGQYGRNSDSSVFTESNMGRSFLCGSLGIPPSREIPNTVTKTPFFLVGDEAFPLKPNIMRPYPRKELDYPKKVYNYRISRARITVERAFGILAKKFGILQTSMETSVEVSEAVVKSICVLHNFIQHENSFNYFPSDDVHDATHSHSSNSSLTATRSNRATAEAMALRDSLKEYFISPGGALEWQDRAIHRNV